MQTMHRFMYIFSDFIEQLLALGDSEARLYRQQPDGRMATLPLSPMRDWSSKRDIARMKQADPAGELDLGGLNPVIKTLTSLVPWVMSIWGQQDRKSQKLWITSP